MLYSGITKNLLTALILMALSISCINVNMPSSESGNKAPGAAATNPPTIESFNASPENLLSGRSGTLSWSVKNADTIMITPDVGKVGASGSKTVQPANETTYTLVASNSAGLVAKPVTIKILTVSHLEVGLKEIDKPGSGTQTTPQGSDKYILGTLDTDLQVVKKPDIKIVESTIQTMSNEYSLGYIITNSGTTTSNPLDVILKIDDVVRSTDHIDYKIEPGKTYKRTFGYKLTPDHNASHRVDIVVDAFNTNAELDESNNTFKLELPYY
jgi:hypothetical protein